MVRICAASAAEPPQDSVCHSPVLDHALDLSSHSQKDQNQPVYHQDRPKDRQIEDLAPRAKECDSDSSGRRVPELELRQSTHEGLELLIVLCW